MSSNHSTLRKVAGEEIEALHAFFVSWFGGQQPRLESEFEIGLAARLDMDFLLIQPGGAILERAELLDSIRSGHGSNPDFRIAIRAVSLRRVIDQHALVTYEEWQRNAKASKPGDNGRLATVLFRIDGDRLRWLNVHETWLPRNVMAAGPYDF